MANPCLDVHLIIFQHRFGGEAACRKRLSELRWPDGFPLPTMRRPHAYCNEKHVAAVC